MPTKKTDPKNIPEPEIIQPEPKHLVRSGDDRIIAGVCGGIAEYFGWDSTLIRLIFIITIILGGSGVLAYLILWLILPSPADRKEVLLSTTKPNRPLWGIFLIGLGLVLLLQNYGLANYLQLDKTWPVILIVLGLLTFSRSSN